MNKKTPSTTKKNQVRKSKNVSKAALIDDFSAPSRNTKRASKAVAPKQSATAQKPTTPKKATTTKKAATLKTTPNMKNTKSSAVGSSRNNTKATKQIKVHHEDELISTAPAQASRVSMEELAKAFVDDENDADNADLNEELSAADFEDNDTRKKHTEAQSKKEDNERKQRKFSLKQALRWLVWLAEVVCGGLFFSSVVRLNMLPNTELALVAIALTALAALTGFKLIRKKTRLVPRIIFALLSIALSVGYIYGMNYLNSTIGFLKDMTAAQKTETKQYSVVVLKESNYEKMPDLADQKLALRQDDQHKELVQEKIQEALAEKSAESVDYADLGHMVLDLNSKSVAALVIADTYVDILNENQKDFADKTHVIYNFEIEFEKEKKEEAKVDLTKEPFAVYISGSDSRSKLSASSRSDVNIIAVVNPRVNKILLVSTPRDFYVQLHGTTGLKDKLTHAGIYGVDMSRHTLEDLLGMKIDHTVKVGFETVYRLVDLLGGIDITSDQAFSGSQGCRFIKGTQHVNGNCALAFSRERHAYASGDRHRGQNQQQVITAIINKATRVENLSRYPEILEAMKGLFLTSMSYEDITGFAKGQLDSLKPWSVESISLDGTGSMQPTYSMGAQNLYVMIPNQATIDSAKAKINALMAE